MKPLPDINAGPAPFGEPGNAVMLLANIRQRRFSEKVEDIKIPGIQACL